MAVKASHSMDMVKRIREGFKQSIEKEDELIRKANEYGYVMVQNINNAPSFSKMRGKKPKQLIMSINDLQDMANNQDFTIANDINGKKFLIQYKPNNRRTVSVRSEPRNISSHKELNGNKK
ncbi:hypothetical protein DCCM_0203 [Desulfocucumis palustris]|uniref:Uncharacterized protein n=1 Tax=Desulfocucumis palustris TaxID=1898651 RepID=A0A2L2X7Q4_9FIRM|nr:hypothetical protein [Desulfocucumis palustris]GBF32012.1 hypothetical protein DCCM_0203 [Desulfocucumis palustris]